MVNSMVNIALGYEIARYEMSRFLDWVVKGGWKAILAIMGLAVAGATAYTLSQSVIQAQPTITQAIAITSYVIPFMAYMFVFQILMSFIASIREMFK